jgi:hypothetical protein
MTQINQYTNEVTDAAGSNPLFPGDLFDVDKLIDQDLGVYESQKMQWGTLLTYLAGGGSNYGNADLTWTANRIHNANNYASAEINQLSKIFEMLPPNDSGNGFQVSRPGPGIDDADFINIFNGGGGTWKYFDNGSTVSYGGRDQNSFFGDDTAIGSPFGSYHSNRNFVHTIATENRKAVVTDIPILPESLVPIGTDPEDAIFWARSISKGVLFPTLTEDARNAIPTPRQGLVIYNTDTDKMQVYTGIGLTGWSNMN